MEILAAALLYYIGDVRTRYVKRKFSTAPEWNRQKGRRCSADPAIHA